jgi:hypothetical protein
LTRNAAISTYRDPLFVVVTLLLLAAIPQLSIPPGHIVTGGDGVSPELDPAVAIDHLRATWFENAGLGFDGSSIRPQLFPLTLGAYCLRMAGLSAESVCRLWYAAVFMLQGAGVAALASIVSRGRLSRPSLVLIAIFAVINPYELITLHGPYLTTQLSVAATPALLALAIRYVRSRRVVDFATCLVVMACVATGDANPAVFLVETLAFVAVMILWARRAAFAQLGALAVAYAGINAVWIAPSYLTLQHDLPFLAPASAQYSDDTLRVVSQFSGWPHSLRLVGEYLFFNNVAGEPYLAAGASYDRDPLLIACTWVVPLCALAGLAIGIRRRESAIVKVGAITLAALFLAKGTAPPLGSVFRFLSEHSVLFRGFRDSFGKFEWIVVVTYAILLGRLLSEAAVVLRPRARIVLATLLGAAVLGAAYPIVRGQLFWPHVVVRVPDRYFQIASYLNQQSRPPTIAELPIAPDVFDSYRWGYIGAGIDPQLIEGPLLSGSSRLLSPINDRVADLLEHENGFPSERISSWLGLYGFNGLLLDTALDPSIFAPHQETSSVPRLVANSRVAWQRNGLSYVAFDDAFVNPRLYVAGSAVVGATSPRQIALACVTFGRCTSLAFVERRIAGAPAGPGLALVRRPLYWSPRVELAKARPGVHVFVDDARRTYEVLGGSRLPPLHVVYPTYPAVATLGVPGARSGDVDALVTGNGVSRGPVRLCAAPNAAKELAIEPDRDAVGLGLIALTYDADQAAAADLVISSRAGALQTRLVAGMSRQTILRTLPLGGDARARIVLEPRPRSACIDLSLFSFARFSPRSPFVRYPRAAHGEPTLYQSAHPDPLRSYVEAVPIRVSGRCATGCGTRRVAVTRERGLPLRNVTPASPGFAESGSSRSRCSSGGEAVYRGEGLRLVPGLRYAINLRVSSGAAAHARTAILSEDELGVAEGAKDIAPGGTETLALPFIASGSLQDAIVYAWIDSSSRSSETCIVSATIGEEAPDSDVVLERERLQRPSLTSEKIDGESYRIHLTHLGHVPALVVLNQTYDDRWTATAAEDTRLEHVSVNGGVNGWIVRGSNDSKISLRYVGSDVTRAWLLLGLALSTVAVAFAVAISRAAMRLK